jgi:HTH-type transcriptional regulator/antitoxin HigA
MELFHEFPLRPIRNAAEYYAAAGVLDRLAIRDEGTLTSDEQDYFDALTLLISAYDEQHHRIDTSSLATRELIQFLMEQKGDSAADLGKVLGSRSAASLLLSGRRVPNRSQCFALAEYFHTDPGLFFSAPTRPSKRITPSARRGKTTSR